MTAEMVNVVIPMAGLGSRFAKAGYDLPKPLLPVQGKPMIDVVIENLRPKRPHRFIFICQQEHIKKYDLESRLLAASSDVQIIAIDKVTQGAACTVLLARKYIDNEQSLMIANCDQFISFSIDQYLGEMDLGEYDGYIMTMTATDPKWSYVRLDDDQNIVEVVEKKVVSSEATVGIYNYARGADFVSSADAMINANDVVNGEFYVAPVYNYMIKKGARIGYYNIGSERNGMYGLGVPCDLDYFNSLPDLPVTNYKL